MNSNTLTLSDGTLIKLTESDFWTIIRALDASTSDANNAADRCDVKTPEGRNIRKALRDAAKEYRALSAKLQGGE